MKKLRVFLLYSYVFLIILILILSYSIISGQNYITGKSVNAGVVISILSQLVNIYIDSPLNTTYSFSVGSNYTLDLKVYSNRGNIDSWWYKLYDLRHNRVVNVSVLFTPNITFNAVRWGNELTVYANTSDGALGSKSVTFYVDVPNTAPILGVLPNDIYMCEGSSLSRIINASDPDEDNLTFSISPEQYFFVWPFFFSGETFVEPYLYSGILSKSSVGNHSESISVSDGQYADTKYTNITVIEINNKPVIDNIGVQTVWNVGENSTFYKKITVNDVESGNIFSNPGNFTINISFWNKTRLFNITNDGIMNFSAIGRDVDIYNITICVSDKNLTSPHRNISICGQDGTSRTSCVNFSLTITNENRPPRIDSFYPNDLTFGASGEESLFFNVSKSDPDGTIPDSYWYVDNVLVSYLSGSAVDSFNYAFPCGLSGAHNVRAVVTDGLLNTSLQWNITLQQKSCPISVSGSGGGGGGGGALACKEKWFCNVWSVCQNLEDSFNQKSILDGSYLLFRMNCLSERLSQKDCGYQIRECSDLNYCNTTYNKPEESVYCHYLLSPNCYDGVKNCHNNDCEVLVDCGGPCNPCPSCSDGIKNQDEDGIDCGTPCPNKCPEKKTIIPKKISDNIIYLLIAILLLLIIITIIIIIRLIKTLKHKYETDRLRWNRLFLKSS